MLILYQSIITIRSYYIYRLYVKDVAMLGSHILKAYRKSAPARIYVYVYVSV